MKRRPVESRTKREEMETYRAVGLERFHKSKAARERLRRRGLYRIIGGDHPSRPPLQVPRAHYLEVRARVMEDFLAKAKRQGLAIAKDQLQKALLRRVESATYEVLAVEQVAVMKAASVKLEKEGRYLTAHEKATFAEALALSWGPTLIDSAVAVRASAVEEVLGGIQKNRKSNPEKLQTAWAELVGAETAGQVRLERVDPAGILWFRCLNSTLAWRLQRDADLPKRCSKALGITVRQLKSC